MRCVINTEVWARNRNQLIVIWSSSICWPYVCSWSFLLIPTDQKQDLKIRYRLHESQPLPAVLGCLNVIHSFVSYLFKTHFDTVFYTSNYELEEKTKYRPCTYWYLSSRSSDQCCVCTTNFFYACTWFISLVLHDLVVLIIFTEEHKL